MRLINKAAARPPRSQPRLLQLSVALHLQWDGDVVGKNYVTFVNGLSESILQAAGAFVDLHQPTALGCPGDRHPFPLEDTVLAVKRQVIGELAHDQMSKQPDIGLAFGDGMFRHGRGDYAGKRIVFLR